MPTGYRKDGTPLTPPSWKGKKRPSGHHLSEEWKKKISEAHKGINTWAKGKPWSEARRKAYKMGVALRLKKPVMENGKEYHPNWREIRKKIYQRDNWHCRECEVKLTLNGKTKIACHHIDYDIKNCEQDNLITLCASCHCKTNFRREDWSKYYQNKMKGALTWN